MNHKWLVLILAIVFGAACVADPETSVQDESSLRTASVYSPDAAPPSVPTSMLAAFIESSSEVHATQTVFVSVWPVLELAQGPLSLPSSALNTTPRQIGAPRPELRPESTQVLISSSAKTLTAKQDSQELVPSFSAAPIPSFVSSPAPRPKKAAPSVESTKSTMDSKPSLFKLNLYRAGAFVSQKTGYWCVPTSVQIMINMITRSADHSYATQLSMWKAAWANIKYKVVPSKQETVITSKQTVYGSDPQGWAAALEQFGGGDYRWVSSGTFDLAVRRAVKALAITKRPVGLIVAHGHHAWVLNGFVATADPAKTDKFKVKYVYVTAPGYGVVGYDSGISPNTKLSVERFGNFLTLYGKHSYMQPYVKDGKTSYRKMYYNTTWTGYYVIIQPVN